MMLFAEMENIVNETVLLKHNCVEEAIWNILSMFSLKYLLDIQL